MKRQRKNLRFTIYDLRADGRRRPVNCKVLWFALVALAFMLAGASLQAGTAAETNAWNKAIKPFQDAKGPTMLGIVETNFEEFRKKYPASEHYAEAVVFEARALFQQE